MEKPREYQVTDLFYTQWSELSVSQRVKIHELNVARNEQPLEQQGTYIILIMRELRKRPLLVDRLNEAQGGYAAPDAKMGNLTFDHFIYADSEFTQCGGDEKAALQHMETLAAILYSPGKLVTNKSYKLPAANALFVKQAFYTFGNVRDYIVSACTHLFPAPAEDAKPMPRNTSALQLWTDMKYALAEQGVFGTYKEVGEQPLYEVITYLEKRAKDPKPTPHAHGS